MCTPKTIGYTEKQHEDFDFETCEGFICCREKNDNDPTERRELRQVNRIKMCREKEQIR